MAQRAESRSKAAGTETMSRVSKTLEKHHTRTGAHLAANGAQGHGLGLRHFGPQGFFKPARELLQRVGVRSRFVQFGMFATTAQRSQFFWGKGVVMARTRGENQFVLTLSQVRLEKRKPFRYVLMRFKIS